MTNIVNKDDIVKLVVSPINLDEIQILNNRDIYIKPNESIEYNTGIYIDCGGNENVFVKHDIKEYPMIIIECCRYCDDSSNKCEIILPITNISNNEIIIKENTRIAIIYNTLKQKFDNKESKRVVYDNDDIVVLDNGENRIKNLEFTISSENESRLIIDFEKDIYKNPLMYNNVE